MKNIIFFTKLFAAWHVFQFNTLLNYFNWYRMILKANLYSWIYKKQFFVIPASKTSLMICNYLFVGYYNAARKKIKLDSDKEKFDQFKMKKISIVTLQDKSYYKTKGRSN